MPRRDRSAKPSFFPLSSEPAAERSQTRLGHPKLGEASSADRTPSERGGERAAPSERNPQLLVLPDGAARGTPRLRPSENHLYFDAVVRHGSIRKAADALHIASSALNRRILDLEHEVGTALFERLPRGVRLTAAGEVLITYVRWSLKELRAVEAQLEQLQGEVRGRVRVAVAESVTPTLLPSAIARYQEQHPGVGFQVNVAGPQALLDALAEDKADLILTHERPQPPQAEVLAAVRHPFCVLVAPDHPLTRLARVALADCAEYPWAVPDPSLAARAFLEAAVEEASLRLQPALESDSIETLKAYARLGRAVCFSFRLGSQPEYGLVPLELSDARCSEANLYVVVRRGRVLPVAAASFAEELQAAAEEHQLSRVSVA